MGKKARKCPKTLKNAKKSARQFYQNHRADLVEVTGRRGAPIRSQSAVRFSTSALAAVMLTLHVRHAKILIKWDST